MFSISVHAKEPNVPLSDRVQQLEIYNQEILQKKVENLEKEINLGLQKKQQELDKKFTEKENEIDDKLALLNTLAIVSGFLLAAGIINLVYQFGWGLKKLAEKTLKEKLQTHLFENTQSLMDLVNNQRAESKVKKEKLIRVVSGSEEETEIMRSLLQRMGFKKVECATVEVYIPFPTSDLLIFCNFKKGLSAEMIINYLEDSNQDDVFVYYGGRIDLPADSIHYQEKLNYANTRFTVYHQIINTLIFKDILKEQMQEV
ncbi:MULTISPECIES: NARF domain-containing protein [Hymenobacteraceae]|uniref:Nucleotidyltransferase-Associated Rossmannoid Fold domain-containing protein n=1 Tax=Nibribacter koreensis TaxID=1084519 RepID=A0ABP8FT18_9BACT|nr:NARF domain-containing protein [Rufibacter sp. DG15C]